MKKVSFCYVITVPLDKIPKPKDTIYDLDDINDEFGSPEKKFEGVILARSLLDAHIKSIDKVSKGLKINRGDICGARVCFQGDKRNFHETFKSHQCWGFTQKTNARSALSWKSRKTKSKEDEDEKEEM